MVYKWEEAAEEASGVIGGLLFDLIPASAEFLKLLVGKEYVRAGELLGVIVPKGWPDDEEAIAGLSWHLKAIRRNPDEALWRVRLIVWRSNRTVIGSINLKGLPDESGTVEIGWGLSEPFRRRGIATEAARAVIKWSFGQSGVKRVIATVPGDNRASERVAERVGMYRTGELKRGLPVWAIKREFERLE